MSRKLIDELVKEVGRLFEDLERQSYYDFLGVSRTSDYLQVRDAFYARAQRFHPDRFVTMDAEAIKQAVYAVYKRMTEAYNVLTDPELRRLYDEGLSEGIRRLPAVHRARRLDPEERQVSNPFARIYLRSGRAKLQDGDLDGAWVDIELGLSLEEASPLRELHTRVIRHMARPGGVG
jgi:DnaJ-class molecular chaperone